MCIRDRLCVYHLKQTLRLNDVKALTGRDDVDFAACYEHLLADKKRMREAIPPLLTAQLPETPDDPEERLCTCLAPVSYTHLDVYKRQGKDCVPHVKEYVKSMKDAVRNAN